MNYTQAFRLAVEALPDFHGIQATIKTFQRILIEAPRTLQQKKWLLDEFVGLTETQNESLEAADKIYSALVASFE